MAYQFDVIVVGGGHAGVEAAAAAARVGARAVLITPNLEGVGQMSCNPAIGGIAKGTVVREVDALGGIMGLATDRSRIQFRMLNRSKGPAVWSPRAQCDRGLYPRAVRQMLETHAKLQLFQGRIGALLVRGGAVRGAVTETGVVFEGRAVVVTTGTFLRGRIHVGGTGAEAAGRAGEPPSVRLAEQMDDLGLQVERFKTGTPPRIDGRSVDYARVVRQEGEALDYRFSSWEAGPLLPQLPCWITWAGDPVKELVRQNLHRSALYGGEIAGRGPRYCPSIEDKIVKFPDAARHQIFLEPEGLMTSEIYVNGLSTSLPIEVQVAMLRSVPGLERAEMTKMGYAIEYDYFPPSQLHPTLEVKALDDLYFAGQINGTTGYEEAAGQGIMAGANAAFAARGEEPLVLGRDDAFIGVLIDDLVTKGTDEPYRLFTSRAEYRLLLRQDNALSRLGPIAAARGLLTTRQRERLEERTARATIIREWIEATNVQPSEVNHILEECDSAGLREPTRLSVLLRRPNVPVQAVLEAMTEAPPGGRGLPGDDDLFAAAEMELRYDGYLRKERSRAATLRRQSGLRIPAELEYGGLHAISTEGRQKLAEIRPLTLGQASRIPGLGASDLQNLAVAISIHNRAQAAG